MIEVTDNLRMRNRRIRGKVGRVDERKGSTEGGGRGEKWGKEQ